MPHEQYTPDGKASRKSPSDLSRIQAWWRTLGEEEDCLALPPPTWERYTQSDGHDDAAELVARLGRSGEKPSFVYWHWQSHDAAFEGSGELQRKLLLHWGGDHEVVTAYLGEGPAGYEIVNGGPQGAFSLDRVTSRDENGLPDPQDPAGIRQFLEKLEKPLHRRWLPYPYPPLTDVEAHWLHTRVSEAANPLSMSRYLLNLERRNALTLEETDRALQVWQERYAGRLTDWGAWRTLLHALLRHDHEQVWKIVDAIGPEAAGLLGEFPSEHGLGVIRGLVLKSARRDGVEAWLRMYQALREPDWVLAANAIHAELTEHDAPPAARRALFATMRLAITDAWQRGAGDEGRDAHHCHALVLITLATDERLPRESRGWATDLAREQVDHVRKEATLLGARYAALTGVDGREALAAVDRFEAVRDDLLVGTGPDLTAYEGQLRNVWRRYRTLTDSDIAWLRAQLAEKTTDIQGIAFCLELLYAHGVATWADVDALVPRWRKVLAKKYRTTYTEWRHPMVTLTCLALDLDHPVAGKLLTWWGKDRPAWKNDLRPLTHLGAPTEAKAAELWEFVTAPKNHDQGHLMTWVLVRARLDQVHPLTVADGLLDKPGPRSHVLHRVIVGLADPAQPLWHYAFGKRSWCWWRRAQEIADDTSLPERTRAVGREAALSHYLLHYPRQVRPAPSEADLRAAREWADRRVEA